MNGTGNGNWEEVVRERGGRVAGREWARWGNAYYVP